MHNIHVSCRIAHCHGLFMYAYFIVKLTTRVVFYLLKILFAHIMMTSLFYVCLYKTGVNQHFISFIRSSAFDYNDVTVSRISCLILRVCVSYDLLSCEYACMLDK